MSTIAWFGCTVKKPLRDNDALMKPIVDRFVPERLGAAGDRLATYKVLEQSATGPVVLIAAYTSRMGAAVRVLRRGAGGDFDLAAESAENWALAGNDSQIRLEDLDFDGRPEAIVYFLGGRLSTGWIFKWDGTMLRNLTPTTRNNDREVSLLLSPAVYDLEHSGALSIVATRVIENIGPGQQARNPAYVYRLGASGYEMQKGILGIMGFRADVDPRGNIRPFRLVADSTPPWKIPHRVAAEAASRAAPDAAEATRLRRPSSAPASPATLSSFAARTYRPPFPAE